MKLEVDLKEIENVVIELDIPLFQKLFVKMNQSGELVSIKFNQNHLEALHFHSLGFTDGGISTIKTLQNQLIEYFQGQRTSFCIPYKIRGTDFQRVVWQELVQIPYGEKISYLNFTKNIGLNHHYVRAVAQAIKANPLPVIIPCHRVIGNDGKLKGYVGGIKQKEYLLQLEAKFAKGLNTSNQ